MTRRLYLVSALLGLVLVLLPAWAAAQTGGTTWDPPRNVSEDGVNSLNPCIVADPWGMVHLFWDENVNPATNYSNVIFYARRDGTSWSRAVDILMSPEGLGAVAGGPAALALPDGRLALVWAGGNGDKVYFSTAYAGAAGSAQAWAYPSAIVAGRAGASQPQIAVDAQNVLHVLYLHPQGQYQGIWHLSSPDGGRSWTAPRNVPGTYVGKADATIFHPAFAIDGSDALHVAWSGSSVEGSFPPDGIYYARSEDGGDTWSTPVMLASGPFSYPVLGTRGAHEVHLMWSGTLDQRRKFAQWSSDGGLSWSRPGTIGPSGGMQGRATILADGDGELHLLFVSSHPTYGDSLFHCRWLGGGWSEPELLLKGQTLLQNQSNAVAAISGGNTLHVAVAYPVPAENKDGWQIDIYALQGHLPVRAIATAPLPPAAIPPAKPTAAPTQTPVASPTPLAPISAAQLPAAQPLVSGRAGTGRILAVGLTPVLLLMAVMISFYVRRRR